MPPRLPLLVAALGAFAPATGARAQGVGAAAAAPAMPRPPRLSIDPELMATQLPDALRAGCDASTFGLGFALGAGYRLRPGLRAEGRLGVFGHPTGGYCVYAVDAPTPSPPPGTTYRYTGFDPALASSRNFGQGRLVGEFGSPDAVARVGVGGGKLFGVAAPFASGTAGVGWRARGVRLAVEAEHWWMSGPVLDRTVVWKATTRADGTPTVQPSATERRFRRDVHVTWARFGVTIPLPGT